MASLRFLVANGPNLGVVGRREPAIYGSKGFDVLPNVLGRVLGDRQENIFWEIYQSNHEGEIIDRLEQAVEDGVHGLILNAGALTHTSLALADCLAWIGIPCVEVHLSNVWARKEPIRQTSLMAKHCLGSISGFGLTGYALAFLALMEHLNSGSG